MLNVLRPGDRLALRLRLARAALLWERVWPACWPALCVLGVFAVVALFDLLPGLPGLAHAAILALFALAFAAAAAWGVRAARRGGWPDASAARRRIEQASGLPHRPLQALADRPSAPLDERGSGAVGGAPAAHGGGAAPAAGRLAGRRPGAARSVGHRARCWRSCCCSAVDRCRRRLARRALPRVATELRRSARRRWPPASTCGYARPNIPGWRRNSCAPTTPRPCRSPTGSTLLAPGPWRRRGAAPRDRRRQRRISTRSTSRISGSSATLTDGKELSLHQGGSTARALADRDRPRQSADDRLRKAARGQPRAPRCGSTTGPATITASRASRR